MKYKILGILILGKGSDKKSPKLDLFNLRTAPNFIFFFSSVIDN